MGGVTKLWAGVALGALLLAVTGCGGGGPTSAAETVARRPLYPWLKGPTRQFLIRGGDDAVQTFGREAPIGERKQASRVIHAWMRTRAAQAWTKDCSYLAPGYAKSLTADAHRVSGGNVRTCPQALAHFGHEASGSYKNTLGGLPIVSLRIGSGLGYAQYHGNDGHDWIVPVRRQNGKWLVANATPVGRSS